MGVACNDLVLEAEVNTTGSTAYSVARHLEVAEYLVQIFPIVLFLRLCEYGVVVSDKIYLGRRSSPSYSVRFADSGACEKIRPPSADTVRFRPTPCPR
jgi:hypothetical protein